MNHFLQRRIPPLRLQWQPHLLSRRSLQAVVSLLSSSEDEEESKPLHHFLCILRFLEKRQHSPHSSAHSEGCSGFSCCSFSTTRVVVSVDDDLLMFGVGIEIKKR